ncbi:uncharacterized protein CPUR_02950 [Claviceps purpurea 20.1]|uniref:Uncharacterized protein n=1 Tax=Claviceps purpurea (strain 20.1) TaxID=1111077 RepID=M1VVC0_CLAP2|nr:uncharacterized protein CPUR_02950 [Claviceps purpurea 20.1]
MDTPEAGNAMYAVRNVPGKGKGLVATRDIPEGTRILSERPLIHVPFETSDEERKRIICLQVKYLNKEQRDIFLSFPNRFPHSDAATLYSGIFRTSCIQAANKPQESFAIFPHACRINHDCDDNATKEWNCDTQQLTVHAMRDIEEGEEITVAYTPFFNTHEFRQETFKRDYHFTCLCRACSLPKYLIEERDRIASQIVCLLSRSQEEWCDCDPSPALTALNYIDARASLFEELGREDRYYAMTISEAAGLAIKMGDLARGRVFSQRAAAIWQRLAGSDNPITKDCIAKAQFPESHHEYGVFNIWSTAVSDVPQDLGPADFDDWLWKREKPRLVVPVGTTIQHRDFFCPFSQLPDNHDRGRGGHFSKNRGHWCFLGEILEYPLFILPMSLEVMDMHNKKTKVHFYTETEGTEVEEHHQKPGSTVAILNATQDDFQFGPPYGIRHKDPRMIKIFPLPLAQILALEHEVRSFSTPQRKDLIHCHGCGKKAKSSSMKRCAKCWSFWYCSKDCQMVGWITKAHKVTCKFLKDPDLRGLFLTQWHKVNNCTGFPLKGVDGPC